ncbi:MAG: hypothetical protein WA771_14560 [Chthoniobacterales bacterium]
MKISLPLLSFLLPLVAFAQSESDIGLLPQDKRAIDVEAAERNPFAKKEVPKLEIITVEDDSASEENQIRSVLNRLSVVGRTRGLSGWKVMFGDMILENGTTLPPVIPGQTQTLRVVSIFEQLMEIEWVEDEAAVTPRKLFIPIELAPTVKRALSGSTAEESGPTLITQ